ncbi:copper amine oxidase [Luteimonas sp. FCS-9]|nr:copper amine oxidase [Luteimonas sp. FCS-9]
MLVHKTATCGCCGKWVDHMRQDGFEVETVDVDDLAAVKTRLGVPDAMASCHTAEIGGYFVEGHVPAQDVRRLLAERPAARGIAAPGMPMGSPGMEMPDGRSQAYTVELVEADGTHRPFAEHPAR